jgi:hypothetical protein
VTERKRDGEKEGKSDRGLGSLIASLVPYPSILLSLFLSFSAPSAPLWQIKSLKRDRRQPGLPQLFID